MPAKIQNVISKTKEDHTTNGQEGTYELNKLEAGEKERGEMHKQGRIQANIEEGARQYRAQSACKIFDHANKTCWTRPLISTIASELLVF